MIGLTPDEEEDLRSLADRCDYHGEASLTEDEQIRLRSLVSKSSKAGNDRLRRIAELERMECTCHINPPCSVCVDLDNLMEGS